MLSKEETLKLLEHSIQGIDNVSDASDANKELVKETLESAIKLIKYPNSYVNFKNKNIAYQNKRFIEAVDSNRLLLRLDLILLENGTIEIEPLTPRWFIDNYEENILFNGIDNLIIYLMENTKFGKENLKK